MAASIGGGSFLMCVNPRWIIPIPVEPWYRYVGALPAHQHPDALVDRDTGEVREAFQVGCGSCLECLNLHKRQWQFRLLDELKTHDRSCFITLTYRETDGNLNKRDYQDFLKRLRRRIEPIKIRYFLCGEYGSRGHRPHYHAAIFGYDFEDKYPYRRDRAGFLMSRSPLLEELWPLGFSSILPANKTTFGYITKDMQKLLDLEPDRPRPFLAMSLKPGIGANGWNRLLTDGKLWHQGQSVTLPRYYKKLAKAEGLDLSQVLKNDILYADNRALLRDFELSRKKERKNRKKLLT